MESFANTIAKLEALIVRLEHNTGVAHRRSPFESGKEENHGHAHGHKEHSNAEAGHKQETAHAPKEAAPKDEGKAAKKEEKKEDKKEAKPKEGDKKKPEQKGKEAALDPAVADFVACEFRIGELTKVWKHPDSDKLYCENINIGKETREIASGLQKFVPIEGMTGKVVVWVNLKSKKLGGFPSHGMVMCASDKKIEGQEKVELCRPAEAAQVGERLFLEGFQDHFPQDQTVEPCSSKVLERVAEKFKTDDQGNIVYNGIKVLTPSGPLKAATLKDANVS